MKYKYIKFRILVIFNCVFSSKETYNISTAETILVLSDLNTTFQTRTTTISYTFLIKYICQSTLNRTWPSLHKGSLKVTRTEYLNSSAVIYQI